MRGHGQIGMDGVHARQVVVKEPNPDHEGTVLDYPALGAPMIQESAKVAIDVVSDVTILTLQALLIKMKGHGQAGGIGQHVLQLVEQEPRLDPEATLLGCHAQGLLHRRRTVMVR